MITRVLVAWLVGAQAAMAADVALVGVHDAELGADEQEALLEAMRLAVQRSGVHRALDGKAFSTLLAGREDLVLQQSVLAEGRRLVEDGRILFQQAQPEQAVDVLEACVEALREGMATTNAVRDLWEAWMLLATSHDAIGQQTAARDAISAAFAVQPERRPDPASYPPSVLELYESERELGSEDPAELTITVDLDDVEAIVSLDGRELGAAPVVVTDVVPGEHHLRVRTSDGRVGYRALDVGSDENRTVELEVGPPSLGLPAGSDGQRGQQIGALYRAIGTHVRVDLILVGGRVDGVMQLQLFDPEVDAFTAPVVLTTVSDTAEVVGGVETLMALIGSSGQVRTEGGVFGPSPLDVGSNSLLASWLMAPARRSVPLPIFTPESAPEPPKKRWPVYVGVAGGVVAAAVITTVAVVLAGDRTPPTPGGTIYIGPPR